MRLQPVPVLLKHGTKFVCARINFVNARTNFVRARTNSVRARTNSVRARANSVRARTNFVRARANFVPVGKPGCSAKQYCTKFTRFVTKDTRGQAFNLGTDGTLRLIFCITPFFQPTTRYHNDICRGDWRPRFVVRLRATLCCPALLPGVVARRFCSAFLLGVVAQFLRG